MARSARSIIDEAIRENRFPEYLLYVFSVALIVSGLIAMFIGIGRGEAVTTMAGAISTSLFWPAMNMTKRIRDENRKLRMLELPLTSAHTAEEAARVLVEFFKEGFLSSRHQGKSP